MTDDTRRDPWSDLALAIEQECVETNRQRIATKQMPLPFALNGARLLVKVLQEQNRPLPEHAIDDDGDITFFWTRRDGRAEIVVQRENRLQLHMEMEGREKLRGSLRWKNEHSVDALLRSFLTMLNYFTPLKQVIVIRRDLKMRQGKSVSQGSHSSGEFMREQLVSLIGGGPVDLSSDEIEWMTESMAKITVRTDTPEQFEEIAAHARRRGLKVRIITDHGRTEFHGVPTVTAMAIGPTRSAFVDPITGGLTLL